MSQILKVDSSDPQSWENTIAKTRMVLKGGGVIAFPTDTFYGLGADPFNAAAVEKIYQIKGRDSKKPLLLLIDPQENLYDLAEGISDSGAKLIKTFWPGPLTLLFKPKPCIPENITKGLIGIRQPGNSLTRKLLSQLTHPLTAPSANFSGEDPATTAEQVENSLGDKVDLILDGGICKGGEPSTLIDTTQNPVQLIREGAINFNKILEAIALQAQESV